MHTHAGEKGTTNGMPLPKAATFSTRRFRISRTRRAIQLYSTFPIFSKLTPPLNHFLPSTRSILKRSKPPRENWSITPSAKLAALPLRLSRYARASRDSNSRAYQLVMRLLEGDAHLRPPFRLIIRPAFLTRGDLYRAISPGCSANWSESGV